MIYIVSNSLLFINKALIEGRTGREIHEYRRAIGDKMAVYTLETDNPSRRIFRLLHFPSLFSGQISRS